MILTFGNGRSLAVSSVSEKKSVYRLPQVWELTIQSNEDMTSDELDGLLTPENIASIEYYNGMETKTLTGYDTVDFVSKTVTETEVSLTIKLLKKIDANNE